VTGAWLDYVTGSAIARATTYTNPLTRDFIAFTTADETFKMTGIQPGNYLLTL
jgi:hypothetical protein